MATSTYTLGVNNDGSQHTGYPNGDKEDDVVVVVPTNVTASNPTTSSLDISWEYTGSGHTGFIIDQFIVGQTDQWAKVATTGATARFWQATGLPGNVQVGHRIRAESNGTLSAWSQEAWLSTLSSQPGGEYAGYSPNRYVTASATGSGSGSESSPWTLRQAMQSATAGDVVGIKPGVYVGENPSPGRDIYNYRDAEGYRHHPYWEPQNAGTPSSRMVFVAQYPAATHTTQSLYTDLRSGSDGYDPNTGGTYYFPTSDTESHASQLGWPVFGGGSNNGDYTTWVGIYSNESDWNNKICEDAGVANVRWVNGHIISLCRIVGSDNSILVEVANNYGGIRFEGAMDFVASDNHISRFGPGSSKENSHAMAGYSSSYYNINNNYIADSYIGIQLKGAKDGNDLFGSMEYNHFHGCKYAFQPGGQRQYSPGDFFPFKHNLVTQCQHVMRTMTSGGVRYNHYMNFENNTIDSANDYRGDIFFQVSPGDPTNTTWKNNILTNANGLCGADNGMTTATMASWADYDWNCYHNVPYSAVPSGGASWSEWHGLGEDTNSLYEDPLFVGGGDYRLQGASPCRGGGEGGATQGCYVSGNEQIGIRT